MTEYLLDTNHASWLMANKPLTPIWKQQSQNRESRFSISTTILAELYFAVYASRDRFQNLFRLQHLTTRLFLWKFDEAAAEEFGKIQAEQKAGGRPIPAMDAQIAAVARIHKLTVLTADHHFQYIENLSIENWLEIK